ncbi:hypothetical protein [Kitasatospora camelliae]|uniref:Uncharacterized protein n=1 Tax=Kitasatospora camelliae TaxID=3156397 RepID=A0AAU8JQB8_9ACTN
MLIDMHAEQLLVYGDSPFIDFREFHHPDGPDRCYRWVHLKRFHLPAEVPDDRSLLAAMIEHPEFRDTYDGAGLWQEPRHGQWWSHHITPDTYRAVDEATASATIRTWADAGWTTAIPDTLDRRLRDAVHTPIQQATGRYALGPLPEGARHDYGPIHAQFHELVLIDRTLGTLLLLVAADD